MRDFPVFTTQYGIASLTLREIPYRQAAYIRLGEMDSKYHLEHLKECMDFCRMAGAEKIYATGHALVETCPLDSVLVEMRGRAWVDPEKMANVFPVTETTAGLWRQIYNRRMKAVPHAATLEARQEKDLWQGVGAYFVHWQGELLGIGWLEDTKLLALASEKPGSGERVLHTLMSLAEGADMTLEVATGNDRAIALYERAGFLKTRELTRWYRVDGTF